MANTYNRSLTLDALAKEAISEGVPLGEIALRRECEFFGVTRDEAIHRCRLVWASIESERYRKALAADWRSAGGLVGKEAYET